MTAKESPKLNLQTEKLTIPQTEEKKDTSTTATLNRGFGMNQGQVIQGTEMGQLKEFQKSMANHVARFEAALFKAITDEPMPNEERVMISDAWYSLFKILIKDVNIELAVACILIVTSHGTVYLMHKDQIHNGLNRIKEKKAQKALETQHEPAVQKKTAGDVLLKNDRLKR